MKILTPSELRELLAYDPETGVLIFRPRSRRWFPSDRLYKAWNTRCANKPALSIRAALRSGHLFGSIAGRRYYAHRAAWAIHYGVWPSGEIDHINGITSDNRISNLRVASRIENARNMPMRRNNSSGATDVYWHQRAQKWQARIGRDRDSYLGLFADFDEAVAARKAAERERGYHPNHGRSQ